MRFPAVVSLLWFGLAFLSFQLGCRAAEPPTQDIFVGSGSAGPFILSWHGILPDTEAVFVNSVPQLRGLDYTLDTGSGTLTFARPVPASSAVLITYALDPTQAQRSSAGQSLPLSLDLVRSSGGFLSLNALGQQNAATGSNVTLGVGVGLGDAAHSQVSSHFYYTPVTAALGTDPNTERSGARTGLSLAASTYAGAWGQFTAGFSRAGSDLADTGDSSIQSGQQTLTVSGKLTPSKTLLAQLSFSQSDPVVPAGTSSAPTNTTTNSTLALTVTPTRQTKLQANVAQTGTTTGGMTQVIGLSASTQATKTVQVSAGFNGQTTPGGTSNSQAINLDTTLTPNKIYSLETAASQSRLGAATTNQQGITLALTPQSAVQLKAGFLLRQKAVSGDPASVGTSEASVSGTVHALSILDVSGSYQSRTAPATDNDPSDQFDTSSARVALAPLKTLKVVGTYDQNPDDATDTIQHLARRGIGLETSIGALGLSGGCDWSRTYATPDVEQNIHADLGLRFSDTTKLTVGYQTQQNRIDPTVPLATAYTVGFTRSLGDHFTFSLNGKRQQTATAAPPDYDASANLGVKF